MSERESSDDEELLANLLLAWEECKSGQAPRTPDEICGERVDLVVELKRRIASLETIDQLISDFNPAFEITALDLTTSTESQSYPVLSGYQILSEIGRGGMGIVFKALQMGLNRIVAIKTIRHGQWGSSLEIARFRSEAEIVARLQHPGVVQIYDVLERARMLWLVLEFVDGKTLAETSRLSPTPPHQAAKLAHEISAVLAAVHAKGILHRDIKPSNILIQANGHVKMTDFGLAKQMTSDTSNTVTGDILGSPSYMAPEQAVGNLAQISERTDVYAIGATLYELLTARPPFTGASAVETLSQVKEQEPVPPRQLVQSIPRDLETICLKCLEKAPGRRYANAADLHEDLGRFISGHPIKARCVSVFERSLRWCRRNTGMAALGSITVAAMITLAVVATWFTMRLAGAKEAQRLQDLALKNEQARAATQEFYARYGRVRERGLRRPNGWIATNLAEIKAFSSLANTKDRRQLLRTEAFCCLCSFDVQKVASLLTDVDLSCLAHHPTQPILALADNSADLGKAVTIRLFDTNTLKALPSVVFSVSQEFSEQLKDGCRSIGFTPLGDKLLVGSRLGFLYVWDTKTWTLVDSWKVHDDWVIGLAVDPDDNESIYTASSSGELKHWDFNGHKLLRETGVTGEVHGFCLTKSHLALSTDTGTEIIDLVDFKSSNLPDEWKRGATAVATCFGRTGILVGSGPRLTQLELDPTHLVRQFVDPRLRNAHQYSVRAVQINNSGRFAVSADGNSFKTWDGISATHITSINVGEDGVRAVEFLSDGNRFVTAGNGGADLYEILQHPGWTAPPFNSEPLFDANLSRNGRVTVELGEQSAGSVGWVGAMKTHSLTSGLGPQRSVTAIDRDEVMLFAEGDVVVTTDRMHPCLRRWDAKSLTELPTSTCGTDPHCLTLSQKGDQFYFVADNMAAVEAPKPPSGLFVCDVKGGIPQLLWSNTASQITLNRSQILSIAAGKKWLATSSRDGNLRIHRAADGAVVAHYPVNSHVTSLAVTHDDSLLLAGDERGNISLIGLPEATLFGQYSLHQNEISGLAIDNSDQTVLSSCKGGEVRIWKLNGSSMFLELISALGPLTGPVKRIAFSGDGRKALILVQGDTAPRILHMDAIRKWLQGLRLNW